LGVGEVDASYVKYAEIYVSVTCLGSAKTKASPALARPQIIESLPNVLKSTVRLIRFEHTLDGENSLSRTNYAFFYH
jgi:hypothetical protein